MILPGRKLVHDLLKQRLILGLWRRGRRRRVEIFLEARLKKRVVADVPTFAVPGDDIAAGIEERYVFAKKA